MKNGIDASNAGATRAGAIDDDPRACADLDGPVAYPRRATVLPALPVERGQFFWFFCVFHANRTLIPRLSERPFHGYPNTH
ncbi:hypothetical protein, partial [Burkholderia ubonensis]|uniref:hypothetical protein n=1 Tax=Burkholderia ubonensis TaxID=101571 RepID=UPI001E47AAC7